MRVSELDDIEKQALLGPMEPQEPVVLDFLNMNAEERDIYIRAELKRRFEVSERLRAEFAFRAPKPLTLMRWKIFTVRVTYKINHGSFGIKYDQQGEFTFCAQSSADARAIAGHHVAGEKFSIDVTRVVEVVDSVPVSR